MVLLSVGIFLGSCLAPTRSDSKARADTSRDRIQAVQSWGYQLQGHEGTRLEPSDLSSSDFDLLVVDYSDGDAPWTRQDLAAMQKKPDGSRRIVLAYLSIGEAEDYRFYWRPSWKQHRPAFLAAENIDWEGNFKVRYWMSQWQEIIIGSPTSDSSYLDQIIAAGFDGVYLDIVDAYELFGPGGSQPERPQAAQDMYRLVTRIARHARSDREKPGFLVVPQNGATILAELPETMAAAYLHAIDAIGAEDTFYYGDDDHDNPLRPQTETIEALGRFRSAGRPVLAVDYLTRAKDAGNFVRLARARDFIPYVGHRELDRLPLQPTPMR